MNTRLQVEHPVTEMVTGTDIVAEQIRISQGENLRISNDRLVINGHAIEARITAELPEEKFRPSPGRVTDWCAPKGDGIRVDTYCEKNGLIPPFYDSHLHFPLKSDMLPSSPISMVEWSILFIIIIN